MRRVLAVLRWLFTTPLSTFVCDRCGNAITIPDIGGNPQCKNDRIYMRRV